jgi:hypothetical protein
MKENQEKENTDPKVNKLIVTQANGGKSKAAQCKQNRTLGVLFSQMTKTFAQHNKVMSTWYQAKGIQNALKQVPDLPNPVTNGK